VHTHAVHPFSTIDAQPCCLGLLFGCVARSPWPRAAGPFSSEKRKRRGVCDSASRSKTGAAQVRDSARGGALARSSHYPRAAPRRPALPPRAPMRCRFHFVPAGRARYAPRPDARTVHVLGRGAVYGRLPAAAARELRRLDCDRGSFAGGPSARGSSELGGGLPAAPADGLCAAGGRRTARGAGRAALRHADAARVTAAGATGPGSSLSA
jgi:hypothetical protein